MAFGLADQWQYLCSLNDNCFSRLLAGASQQAHSCDSGQLPADPHHDDADTGNKGAGRNRPAGTMKHQSDKNTDKEPHPRAQFGKEPKQPAPRQAATGSRQP